MSVIENLLGAAATAFTMFQFIPQALRTWHNRRDRDLMRALSPVSLLIVLTGYTLWGVYAIACQAYWAGAPSLVNIPLSVIMLLIRARAGRPTV